MSVVYYGSRISDHITLTPEGYLICHDVPIARTGTQNYLGRETPDPKIDAEAIIPVNRPEEEVFSKPTLASFEGKPVTDNHPLEDITSQNVSVYMKGIVKNVHRGIGEFQDCIVGDLIIYDPMLVKSIQDGKREISCGYNCLWEPNGSGYTQREIRGNHVAIVDKGRAGAKISIHDSKPEGGRKGMGKKSLLGRILSSFAKDADPEELAEASKMLHAADELPEAGDPVPIKKDESKEVQDEGPDINALMEKIDNLSAKVDAIVSAEKKEPEHQDDEISTLDALEGELTGEGKTSAAEQEKKEEVPVEDVQDEEPAAESDLPKNPMTQEVKDAAIQTIRTMKPLIAGIQDKAQRKAAADSLATLIRGHARDAQYQTVLRAQKQKSARDSAEADQRNLGRNWMKEFNPHYMNKK